MKQKVWVAIGIVVISFILWFIIYQIQIANKQTMLSAEEITERIQEQHPGEVLEVAQSNQDKSQYDVMIETEEMQYFLTVDGTDGNILNMESEAIAQPEKEESQNTPDSLHDESTERHDEEETIEEPEDKQQVIGEERAKEIAVEQFAGTVVDLELDDDDGRLIYEIEIESSRGEAEIEIDAYTGEVILVDIDLEDD